MTRLESERLVLDAPHENDCSAFVEALKDFEVSKQMATPPHPYGEADAKAFVAAVTEARAKGEAYVFVLRQKSDGALVGCCGLHLKGGHFELGYWIAKPYWKQGFATEAANRLIAFAFEELKAPDVWAGWFHDNGRSGKVLGKLGFKADHVEKQFSVARGENVLCNRARLTAEDFGRKKAA
jgi:Acetyltransferases, including N-acetylases of ribosomal proteins